MISVAAALSGLHAQTLRSYDRLGLVSPGRSAGGGRRYSARDIALLHEVQRLSQDQGVNLAGIKRIIDLEKVALLLTAQALDALGDAYAVLTFSGKGPEDVRMRTIKDFGERNGDAVRRRMGALQPEGFTRLGAAALAERGIDDPISPEQAIDLARARRVLAAIERGIADHRPGLEGPAAAARIGKPAGANGVSTAAIPAPPAAAAP